MEIFYLIDFKQKSILTYSSTEYINYNFQTIDYIYQTIAATLPIYTSK